MFPGRLPSLAEFSDPFVSGGGGSPFISIGGGGGSPFPGGGGGSPYPSGGGIDLGGVFRGGGNPASGGTTGKTISLPTSPLGIGASVLSSVLGIPAINWGRIAAFLLGLILIAGGIYLIRPVQNIVNQTVKGATKATTAVA